MLLIDLDRLHKMSASILTEIDLSMCGFMALSDCGVDRVVHSTVCSFFVLASSLVSLSNENADVPDVMNSNRKFDVSLDGTLLSHTTNLNAFVLTPAVRIVESQRSEREKISGV